MGKSNFKDGCPISTTLLETTPQCDGIRRAGETAFAEWALIFSQALEAEVGTRPNAARRRMPQRPLCGEGAPAVAPYSRLAYYLPLVI